MTDASATLTRARPSADGDAAQRLSRDAGMVADLLKLLANQHRLEILCALAEAGEMPVGALVDRVGLSQSALSQHLARLREDGICATRRSAQTIYYRIEDARVTDLMTTLHRLFCAEGGPGPHDAGDRP